MTRTAVLTSLGLGGACLVAVLVARQTGLVGNARPRLHLADATAAVLDTVTVRGRTVEASLGGLVVQVGPGAQVWLDTGRDAFPLRFDADDHGLVVEDRLLATGRVRERWGARWLEVASWVRVEPAVATAPPVPPPAPEL